MNACTISIDYNFDCQNETDESSDESDKSDSDKSDESSDESDTSKKSDDHEGDRKNSFSKYIGISLVKYIFIIGYLF